MKIAGRKEEIVQLKEILEDDESSFLAVYGRRRVGKTYLIREVYKNEIVFDCSGVLRATMSKQLENFWRSLNDANPQAQPVPKPKTWIEAFWQLRDYFKPLSEDTKKVVFLDEIPWFETRNSGFLGALDGFWNQFCTKRTDIVLVICDSAASWIIDKVVNSRGGLHNRLTDRLLLEPLTLGETKAYFDLKRVKISQKDIAEIYMCVGGIPYYLKGIKSGWSVGQILDHLFFSKKAKIKDEFQNLYAALFKNNALHEKVVRALASKTKGLTRKEIVQISGIQSADDLTTVLEELVQCGFIRKIYPILKTKEDSLYRLIDEYTLFYFKFLADVDVTTTRDWSNIAQTPVYKIWSGYAFENLCFKHTFQIKKAMGFHGIISNEYSYVSKGTADQQGIQIDLIIDRADNCVNILEVKFHNKEYEVSESYARQLLDKSTIFQERTNIRKSVFITMLTVFGVKKNEHYLMAVTNQLLLDDLFT
jgi:uncharacterized protein